MSLAKIRNGIVPAEGEPRGRGLATAKYRRVHLLRTQVHMSASYAPLSFCFLALILFSSLGTVHYIL